MVLLVVLLWRGSSLLQNKGRHRSIAYNIFISVVFELLKDLDYKLGRQQLQYDLNDVGIIVQIFCLYLYSNYILCAYCEDEGRDALPPKLLICSSKTAEDRMRICGALEY